MTLKKKDPMNSEGCFREVRKLIAKRTQLMKLVLELKKSYNLTQLLMAD